MTVYTKSPILEVASQLMESTLKIIRKNLIDIGVELSPEKIKLVVFNKRQKYPEDTISLKINQHTIMNSENVKFLGVNLDSALSFREHINEIHAKCSKLINTIKFLREVWWSLHPDTLITIYKSLIRSRMHPLFTFSMQNI